MLPPGASPPKNLGYLDNPTIDNSSLLTFFRFSWIAPGGKSYFLRFSWIAPDGKSYFFLRKEVIQPHLPIRLPCYDFTPVIGPTFGSSLLTVGSLTSGVTDSHGVTGGVYKTRERIHRDILIRDY